MSQDIGPHPPQGHTAEGTAVDRSRERWGYRVWSTVGLIIAVPEIWAAAGQPPWPTISATVGHLEALWSFVAIIVVVLIVFAAARALTHRRLRDDDVVTRADGKVQRRTKGGRVTRRTEDGSEVSPVAYFAFALVVVIGGSLLVAGLSSSKWVLAYAIYGLIATFCVIVPNALAYLSARDVPFPPLFRTIWDLERWWQPAAVVILAGLVVLLIHLAFYPWPDVFRPLTPNSV